MQRTITLDVCDYTNNTLCNLYDNLSDVSGQAYEVFVRTERNGYKEISFKIPSMCSTENGQDKNYRVDYLISDYRLKLCSTDVDGRQETDWFLLSETKVSHNNLTKSYDVKAFHVSHLLKTKNLELEFSDEEGNNVGTIEQLASTILDGTGWHIGVNTTKFYEDEKFSSDTAKEKVRTFTAPAKTGAFKMIGSLCELFDAKPIYHGEGVYIEDGVEKVGRTVDLVPMNPFSENLEEGSIPVEVLNGEKVLALYYDKNVSGITRTLNADNIVTKLSAYGSYGDRTGLCSLQEANHVVLTFNETVYENLEYCFSWLGSNYYFTASATVYRNRLKWSYLDFVSRTYVYDGTHLFKVYKTPKTMNFTTLSYTEEIVTNYFPYIMDFSYYQRIGLLTDDMLNSLAEYQWNMPDLYIQAQQASSDLSSKRFELTQTASSGTGFLKLRIKNHGVLNGNVYLDIDNPDGIIYRSDYLEAQRNYFTWATATGIKNNGTAISGKGSVIYIVHPGSPTTWEKTYIKYLGNNIDNYFYDELGNYYLLHDEINYDSRNLFPQNGQADIVYRAADTQQCYVWFNNSYLLLYPANYEYGVNKVDKPTRITLWTSQDTFTSNSVVYLFSADNIAGLFGPREDMILSNKDAIQNSTKQGSTEKHIMEFVYDDDPAPNYEAALSSYGWYYRIYTNSFTFGELHFCWGKDGDNGWNYVYIMNSSDDPEKIRVSSIGNKYLYSMPRMMLYIAGQDYYEPVKGTTDNDAMTSFFKTVISGCYKQEFLVKGVASEYRCDLGEALIKGNYAFKDEFENYWLFSTEEELQAGSQIRLDTDNKRVWVSEDINNTLSCAFYSFDSLSFPSSNELTGLFYTDGDFVNNVLVDRGEKHISSNISVYENTQYEASLPAGTKILFFDSNRKLLGATNTFTFTTPRNTMNIKLVCNQIPSATHFLRVVGFASTFFVKNVMYKVLSAQPSGERHGITYLMDKFLTDSDDVYITKLSLLKQAQNSLIQAEKNLMESLGDMYREGYWQEPKYAEGDENILYADALDNLKEISHPEALYEIQYLDLFATEKNVGLSVNELSENVDWPDIDISYAVHLVDQEIDINQWAYLDVINKCYDQPWKTSIEINTKLSMIGQQSFSDVLSKIAEVANDYKANQTLYKRSSALTGSGKLSADRLEGVIEANRLYISGGTSNWYTDEKGNVIFEDADGGSAMMFTGRGWAISSEKNPDGEWNWRYIGTGKGITADAIYTGYLSAERIETGSITTDKLNASVGQELEIGSNQALTLYATIDGYKPAGSLETSHPEASDSYIKITAQHDETPASIDIQSGGEINVYGGSGINIESQGKLDVTGGSINISSNGVFNLSSTGKFTVDSQNFKVKNDNTVEVSGKIIATTGNIAGLEIASRSEGGNTITYMYAGSTTSIGSNATGVYVGTDGLNIGGKLKVSKNGASAYFGSTAFNMDAVNGTLNFTADDTISVSSGKTLKLLSNGGNVLIGSTGKPFTVGSDGTNAFIYNGTDSLSSSSDGAYYGTDGLYIRGTSNNAVHYIKATADGNIDISGKITTVEASIGTWTVGSDYIGNGNTRDSSTIGLAKLTSGIVIWAGGARTATGNDAPKFSVQADGSFNALKGTIAGWNFGSDYIGNSTAKNSSTVGLVNTSGSNFAFWAGGTYTGTGNNAPKFSVTADGKLKAKDAEITGTITASSTIACEISADKITSGSMSADRITSGTMSANRISGGTIDANNVSIINLTASNISGGSLVLGGANNTNGTLTIKDANNVTIGSWNNTGLTAITGKIGNWDINENSLSKGSGSSKIVLNADTTTSTIKDYALWIGGETPDSSGLKCKWDGALYATKFVSVSEPTDQHPQGQEQVINLSQYPLWKLWKPYISSHTDNSITLSDGTTINFSKPTVSRVTVGTRVTGTVYNVSVSLSDARVLPSTINCSSVYTDARSGYTPGTYTQYSGAQLYTMGQSGPERYTGTLYVKS